MSEAASAWSGVGVPWAKLLAVVALGLLCLALSWQQWRRLRRIAGEPQEADELEARLRARELMLVHSLSLRNARAAGRVVLAAGTGLALVELIQGGAARLPHAALIFGAGGACWAGCQEVARRLGSRAETDRSGRRPTRSGPGRTD